MLAGLPVSIPRATLAAMIGERHPPNIYAAGGFDRADERRGDAVWLADQFAAPESRVLLVWRELNLVAPGERPVPVRLPTADLADHIGRGELVLLGLIDGVAHFALDLSVFDDPGFGAAGTFADLRQIGPTMARLDGALAAYARGMMYWHARHKFCGFDGAPTESRRAGHVRVCTKPGCGAQIFPRVDPAVIMLVEHGDYCLLGRQTSWAPGRHSTLAGFVEPGESLEDAVRREIMEEAGLAVENVRYHSSQPWPFPSSIMLGFYAEAASRDLTVNTDELESAEWFHRDALRAPPEDDSFSLPSRDSIAYRLIQDWLDG